MKRNEADESEVSTLLPSLAIEDQVFPYATLMVQGVLENHLQKVADFFTFDLISIPNGFCLRPKDLKIGEHKLQTVDLLAAAICIHRKFSIAKMSLNVRNDFMKETRDFQSEFASELMSLPNGYLRISPASQLFLSQAGFLIEAREVERRYSSNEVIEFEKQFQRSSKNTQAVKGA